MIRRLKISQNMYLDKDIFSRLTSDKGHKKLLILEFLSGSRRSKTLSEILEHLSNSPMRRASDAPKSRGVRVLLDEMVAEDMLKCNSDMRPWTWDVTGKLRELENIPITKANLPYLLIWIKIFEKYSFLPFFEDIQGYIDNNEAQIEEQLDGADRDSAYRIVDFDTRKHDGDQSIVSSLYRAIEDCETISISYRSFGKTEPKSYLHINPYLLKEHNHRWYLIATVDQKNSLRVFPLDRIVSILEAEDEAYFARDASFNPDKLWEHSMGIDLGWTDSSGNYRNEPVEISFEVKDGSELRNIAYLETSPIHRTQKLKGLKDGFAKVSMNTFPVADAVRAVRALGVHNLRNIKPDYFAKWVLDE
ncbi:helix-turn-helix transcriptional regulator [Bacteroidota bacterium]